jgi:hypothetical protein
MKRTSEQRAAIARKMRGNKNAAGGHRVFVYRPSINRSNALALLIHANSSPIEFDWVSGGRIGISTNDPERAAAWVAKARELGYKVRDAAPRADENNLRAPSSRPKNWAQIPYVGEGVTETEVMVERPTTLEQIREPWDD